MGDDYAGPVTVAANDGSEKILATPDVWGQSETIAEMVKDTDPGDTIPLASVTPEALEKVMEWMYKIAGVPDSAAGDPVAWKAEGGVPVPPSDEAKSAWIVEYKRSLESQEQLQLLFATMTAANFMNVPDLLDELCKFVAEMIAQRTPTEILEHFNITKDATWEEEKQLIAEYEWIDPEGLIAKDRDKRLAEKGGKGGEARGGPPEAVPPKGQKGQTPEETLVEMGFPLDQVREALTAAEGDKEAALEMLLTAAPAGAAATGGARRRRRKISRKKSSKRKNTRRKNSRKRDSRRKNTRRKNIRRKTTKKRMKRKQ